MEFTYEAYSRLLDEILSRGYSSKFFTDDIGEGTLLLRHDIDFSPRKSLKLAEVEEDKGVTATYFFLLTSPLYNTMNEDVQDVIFELLDRGHQVGLHFDAHQYWGDVEPSDEDVETMVEMELNVISNLLEDEVDLVAFHNPPDWVFNRSFDGFTHTYDSPFFGEIEYISDSNQRWRSERPLSSVDGGATQVLTHPVQWGDEDRSKDEFLKREREYIYSRIDENIEKAFIDSDE